MPEYLKMETPDSPPDDPPLKKILLWNDMYGKPHYFFGLGREPFVRAGCRVNTCYTTADRLRFPLDQLDAVAWHFRAQDQTLPSQRSTHTRYVFVMQESPMNLFGDLHHYDGVFNWTLTYRLDSDFPSPHGFVTQRSQHSSHDGDGRVDVAELVANKTKLAAWFVSNCHSSSGRESLARTLQNYFPLDIYGKCGVLECPRVHQNQCYTMLQKDYKFYMAFENSLCRDYITEKFFGVLEYYVVPVVWGSGNYTTQAPPHSFIDASRFPSVYDLAQYLLYLHHNDTAYMEYFK
ncbi:alpha-(1,3)-fucosyltransferase C-like [Homarus americanus]|uniref:alpha-(1,3)-fucosyltransferase C-like n=1 Tax=Homarus americanus TaxID=6706 RepID=UPI001C454835|nr:alpha-(1,3)-fucosyltransferase C-like [Homarus americanus]